MADMAYNPPFRHASFNTGVTPVARSGTITSPTLGFASDKDPASLCVSSSTSILLEYDLGSAVLPVSAALYHHNVKDSTTIYVLSHTAANDWASGSVVYNLFPRLASSAFAPYGVHRPNPYMPLITSAAKRYWALGIGLGGGADLNDVSIKFGDFQLMSAPSTFSKNPDYGMHLNLVYPPGQAINVTRAGVRWVSQVLGYQRRWSGVIRANSAFAEQLYVHYRTCLGRTLPFTLVPDSAVSDCALVYWDNDFDLEYRLAAGNGTVSFAWLEAANGPELLL